MAKVGISTSLLNTSVTGKPLLHNVRVSTNNSEKKIVVIDSDLWPSLQSEIMELEKDGVICINWEELCHTVSSLPISRPPRSSRNSVKDSDPLLYVFTSGTTGLPKAAKISSTRFLMATIPARVMTYMQPGERMYCCLPLYHSAGGILAAGGTLLSGATLVLRRKFSVRNFTSDCLKYRCTSIQYIGELCRFLLNAPVNPDDSKLHIKYALGNGLRADVWEPFRKRYNIGRIIELYSATESNIGMANSSGKVGSVGCIPRAADIFYPVRLIRVDPVHKDVPLRDPVTGRCVLVDVNEPGLVVGLINNKSALSRFEGYSDHNATGNKILRGVFSDGDTYFNSGDLLRRDWFGFYYWVDRVGDTFRWKGENVASTEVEHVLSEVSFVSDVVVYGVPVPGCEGKAGMAAIALKDSTMIPTASDWRHFHDVCCAHLAPYARPVFIRIQNSMALTSTFKHKKTVLVEDGFDPRKVRDNLFYYSHRDGTVCSLDLQMYERIASGSTHL